MTGRNVDDGNCVAKKANQCANQENANDIADSKISDVNGSCQNITPAQCWTGSGSSVTSNSKQIKNGSYYCTDVSNGTCWDPATTSWIEITWDGLKGRNTSNNSCVDKTAAQCVSGSFTFNISSIKASDINGSCQTISARTCWNGTEAYGLIGVMQIHTVN